MFGDYGINYGIGRSSNGRTEAFEAFNRGSIPCLPAKQIVPTYFMSLIDFNIDNITLTDISSNIIFWIFLAIIICIIIFIYNSKTKLGFKFRKKIRLSFSKVNTDNYKKFARILFIDDKDIPVAQSFEDDGWSVQKVRDAKIDDIQVKIGRAHV